MNKSSSKIERVKMAISWLSEETKMSVEEIGILIGRPETVCKLMAGKKVHQCDLTETFLKELAALHYKLSQDWLMDGTGEMLPKSRTLPRGRAEFVRQFCMMHYDAFSAVADMLGTANKLYETLEKLGYVTDAGNVPAPSASDIENELAAVLSILLTDRDTRRRFLYDSAFCGPCLIINRVLNSHKALELQKELMQAICERTNINGVLDLDEAVRYTIGMTTNKHTPAEIRDYMDWCMNLHVPASEFRDHINQLMRMVAAQ